MMATKTISVSEDVYSQLEALKLQDESFSDLLKRILKKKNPLAYFGVWKDIPDKEWNAFENAIEELRNDSMELEDEKLDKEWDT